MNPSDREKVGYKRPPEATRFQKGRSGNPKGRPKKKDGFIEDAIDIFGGSVQARLSGEQVSIPVMQAMFRKLCGRALRGDRASLKRVVELVLTLEPSTRELVETPEQQHAHRRQLLQRLGIFFDNDEDYRQAPPSKLTREEKVETKRLEKVADTILEKRRLEALEALEARRG